MRSTTDRILTTHTGSLPRGPELTRVLHEEAQRGIRRSAEAQQLAAAAVREVVVQQIECGIDVVNDGEQGKVGFQTYIPQRMSGFGGEATRRFPPEFAEFPTYVSMLMARLGQGAEHAAHPPAAIAEVRYESTQEVAEDCEVLRTALARAGHAAEHAFLPAPSPGVVATTMTNQFYESHEAYVRALARELRKEYAVIIDSGLILQIDAPDLAMDRSMYFQDLTMTQFLEAAELHVDALNSALEGFPRERVRLHCCWGNVEGPHTSDVSLAELLPVITQAHVGALGIAFGNPRHQHEIDVLAENPLPEPMSLIAGVVDVTTNYVEHPEVISRRIRAAARALGDIGRIIASPDCGFGTFAGYQFVAQEIVWAKLKALREGADLAARALATQRATA